MSSHFADRLIKAIREKNAPVCVGLDPLIERFPPSVLRAHGLAAADGSLCTEEMTAESAGRALLAFGREVIGTVAPLVAAIKINIAFFERYHAEGVRVYGELVRFAGESGLIVIGDVKRADIGHSTTQYARAHLGNIDSASATIATSDAVTVNPYFGFDAIRPFVDIAVETGRGVFVLVQTSNESAGEVQGLTLSDGTVLCERVAQLVSGWASEEKLLGTSGYSCVGAVVSPRDLESTRRIRTLMPSSIFLVPGFGAQGRSAREVAQCFKPDGTGAIVNASRSVIFAHNIPQYGERYGEDWTRAVEHACKDLVAAIRSALQREIS